MTLFDQLRTPAAKADPHTSHLAADAVTRSGSRARNVRKVADMVGRRPGMTSRELADAGMDRHECARRLPEAEAMKLVRRGEARKCGVSGKQALTWFPVEQGGVDEAETDR